MIIRVTDEGAGIPDSIRHRLFSAFTAAPHAPDDAEGNGLGLLVAHQLLGLMDAFRLGEKRHRLCITLCIEL